MKLTWDTTSMGASFPGLYERIESAARRELHRFCGEVAETARNRCPAGSGALRESIHSAVHTEGERLIGEIAADASYAVYVHEGTGRYHPRGRKSRWVYPVEGEGGVRFYSTEGRPPVPFLRDAMREARRALGRGGKDHAAD